MKLRLRTDVAASMSALAIAGACAAFAACTSDKPEPLAAPDASAGDEDAAAGEQGIVCPPSGVSKGPWSLVMTRTSMKVRWEACKPGTNGSVFVRPEAGGAEKELPSVEKTFTLTERHHSLNVESPDDAPGTFYMHDTQVTDLTPGTCYHYELGADRSLAGRFCTSQPDGGRVHFMSIGDTNALLGNSTRNVLSFIVPRGPEFIVHGGDWQYYDSVLETWAGWFPVMKPMLALGAMQPTLGNHEKETPDELDDYSMRFFGDEAWGGKDMYYRFESGGLHFFVLDTDNPFGPSTTQGAWLTKALGDAAALPSHRGSIIVMHRLFVTCGDTEQLADDRAAYAPIFKQNGVVLVLQAHMHGYERFDLDGLAYVTSAGGGGKIGNVDENKARPECASRVASGGFFHAIDFVAEGKTLTGTTIDDKGAIRDTFTIPLK